MSLRELSEQKKVEIRREWENKVKKIINSATGTHVKIDSNVFPASRNYELNAERRIICDILEEAGLKYSWIQSRRMGWTEWQHWVIFTVTLG